MSKVPTSGLRREWIIRTAVLAILVVLGLFLLSIPLFRVPDFVTARLDLGLQEVLWVVQILFYLVTGWIVVLTYRNARKTLLSPAHTEYHKNVITRLKELSEKLDSEFDPKRKASVVRFLAEAKLIEKDRPIVSLHSADLRDVDLSGATLQVTNLSGADLSDGEDDDKIGAVLYQTVLYRADLRDANLSHADLSHAALGSTVLLGADLSGANLSEASLTNADLSYANLSDAIGTHSLGGSRTTEELEQQAWSLEGATMPDGSEHD